MLYNGPTKLYHRIMWYISSKQSFNCPIGFDFLVIKLIDRRRVQAFKQFYEFTGEFGASGSDDIPRY